MKCTHDPYWKTQFGNCMACRAENYKKEAEGLRTQQKAIAQEIILWFSKYVQTKKELVAALVNGSLSNGELETMKANSEVAIQLFMETVSKLEGEQAARCAVCGEFKHTPMISDTTGGYVCLTCLGK